jgi:hypothetical protein
VTAWSMPGRSDTVVRMAWVVIRGI